MSTVDSPTGSGLAGTTALVTGASRGFGRGSAVALAKAGAHVVAVARGADHLADLRAELGDAVTTVVADVTDAVVAGHLIDAYRPHTLVLNAGATPLMRTLRQHSWESFSRCWEVDVRHVFNWTREALLRPLERGSVVLAMSSGAAVNGSPLSGGYAGSKATVRFISKYAAGESAHDGSGIRFVSVLPKLTPTTDLGRVGVTGYAAQDGLSVDEFVTRLGPSLTPELVGAAIVDIAADPGHDREAYLLTADGLSALD